MGKNPHMSLSPLRPLIDGVRHWRCDYCGDHGPLADLQQRECGHVYPPCRYCGQAPECALDCPGIVAALSGKGVHVVGELPDATTRAITKKGQT